MHLINNLNHICLASHRVHFLSWNCVKCSPTWHLPTRQYCHGLVVKVTKLVRLCHKRWWEKWDEGRRREETNKRKEERRRTLRTCVTVSLRIMWFRRSCYCFKFGASFLCQDSIQQLRKQCVHNTRSQFHSFTCNSKNPKTFKNNFMFSICCITNQ